LARRLGGPHTHCERYEEETNLPFLRKREDVSGNGIELCNGKLHGLLFSRVIIRFNKRRRMRLAGRVAHVGEKRMHTYSIFIGSKNYN
jgi:hypothetical protein